MTEHVVEVWHQQACPGCGRDVAFLAAQQSNICGWCKRLVLRVKAS